MGTIFLRLFLLLVFDCWEYGNNTGKKPERLHDPHDDECVGTDGMHQQPHIPCDESHVQPTMERTVLPSPRQVNAPDARERAALEDLKARLAKLDPNERSGETIQDVVYAVGNEADRRLGIPGEGIPGSAPAALTASGLSSIPNPEAAVDLQPSATPCMISATFMESGSVEISACSRRVAAADACHGAHEKRIRARVEFE